MPQQTSPAGAIGLAVVIFALSGFLFWMTLAKPPSLWLDRKVQGLVEIIGEPATMGVYLVLATLLLVGGVMIVIKGLR